MKLNICKVLSSLQWRKYFLRMSLKKVHVYLSECIFFIRKTELQGHSFASGRCVIFKVPLCIDFVSAL